MKVTEKEAIQTRAKFFKIYKGLKDYHDEVNFNLNNSATGAYVSKTLYGRLAYIDRFTNGCNFPIQGSGADIIKLSVNLIIKRLEEQELDAMICNIVHDEIVIDCSRKQFKKVSDIAVKSMEETIDSIIKIFKTPIDVEILDNYKPRSK